MNALHLTLFVSAMLVIGWMYAFLMSVKRRDHDHFARSSLMPLDDDTLIATATPTSATPSHGENR